MSHRGLPHSKLIISVRNGDAMNVMTVRVISETHCEHGAEWPLSEITIAGIIHMGFTGYKAHSATHLIGFSHSLRVR